LGNCCCNLATTSVAFINSFLSLLLVEILVVFNGCLIC
jgi:hypothetical protein